MPSPDGPIGRRVVVVGTTSSGKSTLGARLSKTLGVPFVELDALNWEPNWHSVAEHDPAEFERRIREATEGDGWVVAGSYSKFSERTFWPRLETVVWLDLPLRLVLWRVVTRSWRRWRTKELLWGTNTENLWTHLKLWSPDSLIYWAVTTHRVKRRRYLAQMTDPAWAHIRYIRLTTPAEVEAFARAVEAGTASATEA
ncbi:MAG: adenylate kinase [Dehalococcoidia bacterium]|nr:adenylate kinase [Dehalococcoidia bacterium]